MHSSRSLFFSFFFFRVAQSLAEMARRGYAVVDQTFELRLQGISGPIMLNVVCFKDMVTAIAQSVRLDVRERLV